MSRDRGMDNKRDREYAGSRKPGKRRMARQKRMKNVMMLTGFTAAVAAVLLGNTVLHLKEGGKVYASAQSNEIVTADGVTIDNTPAGINGVIAGVTAIPEPGSRVNRIGTSGDHILVGQRVQTIGSPAGQFDVGESAAAQASRMNAVSIEKAASASMMSDSDYSTLLRIVEAEAGDDDIKGRVLVANVIMNRVAREDFPDTVTDVVFQNVNGVPQFAPTYDGAFYRVEVTDDTREAVRQALSGTDYSEGALFFVMKDALSEGDVSWFDTDLKHLFKYGVHDFYTYPEETDPLNDVSYNQDVQIVASAKD